MRRRFLSLFLGVVLCLLCMSPAFVFASEQNDSYFKKNFDAICSTYGLSGDLSIDENFYYIYGRKNGGTGNPISVLWVGGRCYRCEWQESAAIPSYNFYTATYPCNGNTGWVGHAYMQQFYYSASDSQTLFISGYTDNLIFFNQYADCSDGWNFSTSSTYEEFSNSFGGGSSGSTESTENPPFQLPDDWLNGGNTLETREPSTFENLDSDSALEEFENLTDVEFETSFLDAVSFYWSVVIGVIDAMGIWVYVYVSMTILLIAFLLGRNI